MADRDRRRGHCGRRALFEMRGAIERLIAHPGSPWGGRRTSSLTGEWFGFCRSQPTGGSCVGNDGETQLRRALNQGAGSCRTSQEANAVMLSLAPDVELGWTKFSASLPLQGNRA
jgi:hypothetical protein